MTERNSRPMLGGTIQATHMTKQINLSERIADYSIYFPSVQPSSAKNVRMTCEQWQAEPLPHNLQPQDFDYLRSNNRFWSYRYALASAESFKDTKTTSISAKDPQAFILGDSGGFQIGKGTFSEARTWKNYRSKRVMQAWRSSTMREEITQWCETNCAYAMTIDIPLWVKREQEKNSPFRHCTVSELLELTVENLQFLDSVRGRWSQNRSNCKYLNVLQGDKESDEDVWYDAVKNIKFDGWAFAGGIGIEGGPYRILRRLLLMADEGLLDAGYDWLHLLMLGQLPWAPFVTAIQRAIRRHNPAFTISYDSSSAYKMGGQHERYFWADTLTNDIETWKLRQIKLPSTYGYANSLMPIKLCQKKCKGVNKCDYCVNKGEHLERELLSPIANLLTIQDLLSKEKMVRRRSGRLFDEVLINHNVYVIIDGVIRANEAVFLYETAPDALIDACGTVAMLFEKNQNWDKLLNQHRKLFESALAYKAPDHVIG